MVQAYNFLASWQLFPERGIYQKGERPISAIYRISAGENHQSGAKNKSIEIHHSWVGLNQQGFSSSYSLIADQDLHSLEGAQENDSYRVLIPSGIDLEIHFYREGELFYSILHHILSNGYLRVIHQGYETPDNTTFPPLENTGLGEQNTNTKDDKEPRESVDRTASTEPAGSTVLSASKASAESIESGESAGTLVKTELWEGKKIAWQDQTFYHKQMSVLPYSASVSGAVIKPTEEGLIRHKALTAMEEQTNMQLEQIRKQVELLAMQAQEIQKRKELSLMIYQAKINFTPVIGQTYHLYEKKDGSYQISLISPKEWGGGTGPFKSVVASVKLLADHTWTEIN